MKYNWEQVKKCNGENGSYWIVINGNVHDVTQFLKIVSLKDNLLTKI